MTDKVLNVVEGEPAFVQRTTDPVILPQPYAQPADFAAQYPVPLDTTEIIRMCEEVTLLQFLPEQRTSLNTYTWREMTTLAFTSGSAYVSFADGECPEEYSHNGSNASVYLKNIGAKKTLSIRDIMHSTAIASAGWNGINRLVDGFPASEGMPGGSDFGTFQRETVLGVKEKEVRLAMTLVLNAWDRLLVQGNENSNSLEFTGIENWATVQSCTLHTNNNAASGTFTGLTFDRFLAESCAKPTAILGHPQAIQEMMAAYFQLGFAGAMNITIPNGDRITPGYNFAGFVNTGVGKLLVVADNNFAKVAVSTTTFSASLWALRMTHNGEPLVYKLTQIPLSLNDLVPGCTAISFEVWAATSFVMKACCAQGRYDSVFTGRIASTCTVIG